MTTATPPQPALPPIYLTAEAAARENLDRPDHTKLAQLLAMSVSDCGNLVADTSDDADLALREALPRAARILDPNTYVPIGNKPPSATAINAALHSPCPVMRRFAAAQNAITLAETGIAPVTPFPTDLQPDGDCIYVPYEEGAAANVTLESVAAQQAKDGPGVVGTIDPPAPIAVDSHPAALPAVDKPTIIAVETAPTAAIGGGPVTTVTVQTKEGFFQHIGTELHDVIARAMSWCQKIEKEVAAKL